MSEARTPDEVLRGAGLSDPVTQLSNYIQRQRWFSGRDRGLVSLEVEDAGVLEGEPRLVSAMLRAHYRVGESQRYHVPLAVRPAGQPVEGLVAEGEEDGSPVVVLDALLDRAAGWRFWRLAGGQEALRLAHGQLVGVSDGYDPESGPADVHALPRDQTNTMLVRGDSELLKCFRRLEAASSPEFEMLNALKAAGFPHIPAPMGVIEYRVPGEEPVVAAMVQPYLHNATDGWALAMTSLRDVYAEAEESRVDDGADATAIREMVDDQGSDFTPDAARLGVVVAEMHLALGGDLVPDAMRAEPAGPTQVGAWSDEMVADLDAFSRSDAAGKTSLDALRERIEALRGKPEAGMAIRVHGDLHLGQTARTDSGWVVLDFEGEPSRSVEARRRKASPLRDVAGMLRSFDYASAVALLDRCDPDDPDWRRLQRVGDVWAAVNREAFWGAYVGAMNGSPLLPSPELVPGMLDAYLVQKALYEVGYELGHRPDWAWIPLRYLEAIR